LGELGNKKTIVALQQALDQVETDRVKEVMIKAVVFFREYFR